MHVLVLGAGLAGLSAAYELARSGQRVTVLELDDRVGGMASSFRAGGHWLDHGPHRFFSRDERLVRHLYDVLDDEVVVRRRLSRIHLRGRYFHYPLKAGNVVRNLPPSLLLRSLWDYAAARVRDRIRPVDDRDFESWVVKRFGRTLYRLFFGAYTEKAWGMPPSQISSDWASQRISQASLLDAIRRTLFATRDGEARGLATEFYYPRTGGIGALARAYEAKILAAGGEILCGARVTGLDRDGDVVRRVRFERDGRTDVLGCDHVVSTIPLTHAVRALDPGPEGDVIRAAARLRHLAIVFVYLEVDRPSVSPDHWIYLPESHLRVHRVSEFKNFSDASSPGDRTAVCCEITCRAGDPVWGLGLPEAARIAEADLVTAGLIRPGEARPLALRRLRWAYPVYDLEYRDHLHAVRRAAGSISNLTSTGRQGLFRYNNMDHSVAMGLKAARAVAAAAGSTGKECAA